jgi:hypothetical protein
MANITVCWSGQVTAPWPAIRVHAVCSMRYHSILKIADAKCDRWHQSSSLFLLTEAQSIYSEAVVVLYCFKPSSMFPGLLPGSMELVIYCSYRNANNVLNVDLLVLSVENFPNQFLGAFATLQRATSHGTVHRRWFSRNTNKMLLCNRIYYSQSLLKAQHVSSGTPLIIRSSKLRLQPLVYIHMWWPAVAKAEWEMDQVSWLLVY